MFIELLNLTYLTIMYLKHFYSSQILKMKKIIHGNASLFLAPICLHHHPLPTPGTQLSILYLSAEVLSGTSLVAQWLRIHLPMQGTRVRALVREDPTCHRAVKPVRRNYWACALEPVSCNYRGRGPQLLKPARLEPVLHKRSHCSEKPVHRNKA